MVVPLLEKYDMRSASLFGSYARNEADENSDIDLLLEGNPGFRPFDVFEISELDEGEFRDRVLREAIRL